MSRLQTEVVRRLEMSRPNVPDRLATMRPGDLTNATSAMSALVRSFWRYCDRLSASDVARAVSVRGGKS